MDKSILNGFLDLVAISTVADVVPLLDENRTMVKYGLEIINRRQRNGLDALLTELSLEGPIDASGISFVIAPNINALGRMGSAEAGVELLAGYHSDEELAELAADIAETNRSR
ncbi:MAG: single-stranded-DNA-specific exonuclease RecJ, partial [Firmicutes bacterium]|nr:single-stranded-DNA-specific exonuclease RecJ [Bacillota bacterium]